MYTPVTSDEQRIQRMEAQLNQAPKKQSVYYHEQESVGDYTADMSDNQFLDTSGYQNYLKEVSNVQISNGPFVVLRDQRSNDCFSDKMTCKTGISAFQRFEDND